MVIAENQYCISRQIMAIRPKKINSHYLFFYRESLQKSINEKIVGQIPGIKCSDIQNLWIDYPSKKGQDTIIEIIILLEKYCYKEINYLLKLRRIKQKMISDLLTGRVRVPIHEVTPHDP